MRWPGHYDIAAQCPDQDRIVLVVIVENDGINRIASPFLSIMAE